MRTWGQRGGGVGGWGGWMGAWKESRVTRHGAQRARRIPHTRSSTGNDCKRLQTTPRQQTETATHLPWAVDAVTHHRAALALAGDLGLVPVLATVLHGEEDERAEGDGDGVPFCRGGPSTLELACCELWDPPVDSGDVGPSDERERGVDEEEREREEREERDAREGNVGEEHVASVPAGGGGEREKERKRDGRWKDGQSRYAEKNARRRYYHAVPQRTRTHPTSHRARRIRNAVTHLAATLSCRPRGSCCLRAAGAAAAALAGGLWTNLHAAGAVAAAGGPGGDGAHGGGRFRRRSSAGQDRCAERAWCGR